MRSKMETLGLMR